VSEGRDCLVADGLVKQYQRVRAVDGISLRVGEGERVGLLGPNGAGKSTTLLMLLGVVTPDEGTVEVLGRRMPKERSLAMQQVGFAAGYVPLPDKLRVREVLSIFGELYGMRRPEAAVASTLERLRIPHLAEAMCGEMSSGQKTLVGIAKAILHRPRLLVLDEPTEGIQPSIILEIEDAIAELHASRGLSILLVEQYVEFALRLADRYVVLDAGEVVASGETSELADDSSVRRLLAV
jgi:ABC-2 type transport system ATP-binding protein